MVLFPKYQAVDDFSEKIFIHLNLKSLNACQKVNKAWFDHVNDPKMWLEKCFMDKSRWLEMDLKLESHWTLARQQWDKLLKCLVKSESCEILKKDFILSLKSHQKLRVTKWVGIPNFSDLAPAFVAIGAGKLELLKFILDNSKSILGVEEPKDPLVGFIQIDFEDLDATKMPTFPEIVAFAIFVAVLHKQEDILKYVIERYGIENLTNIQDQHQQTPIIYAAYYGGSTKMIAYLQEYTTDPIELEKALYLAALCFRFHMIWMINPSRCVEEILVTTGCILLPTIILGYEVFSLLRKAICFSISRHT